jgi:hypothetical protein
MDLDNRHTLLARPPKGNTDSAADDQPPPLFRVSVKAESNRWEEGRPTFAKAYAL